MNLFAELPQQVAPVRPGARIWTTGQGAVRGQGAVMAGRKEAADSLDFFPTPPWVGRSLITEILPAIGAWQDGRPATCLEPAIGAGHLAAGMIDAGWQVIGGDVVDYGAEARLQSCQLHLAAPEIRGSFIDGPFGPAFPIDQRPDWVCTNPPFRLSIEFVRRALEIARYGVAMFTRLAWLESAERWRLRQYAPLWAGTSFAERVALLRHQFDPDASSATAYGWMIWRRGPDGNWSMPGLIEGTWCMPPGAASRWSRPVDAAFIGTFEVRP